MSTDSLTETALASDTAIPTSPGGGPGRARAVFSTDDFRLMRAAVVHYLKQPEVQDGPDSIRYANLYHRLGRLG